MEIRSIVLTILILAVVGVIGVAMQLTDSTDILSRLGIFTQGDNNSTGEVSEETEANDVQLAEETRAEENEVLAQTSEERERADEMPRNEEDSRQENVLNSVKQSDSTSEEIAGAHDVNVTAETGAGNTAILAAVLAMVIGGAGMAGAKFIV